MQVAGTQFMPIKKHTIIYTFFSMHKRHMFLFHYALIVRRLISHFSIKNYFDSYKSFCCCLNARIESNRIDAFLSKFF